MPTEFHTLLIRIWRPADSQRNIMGPVASQISSSLVFKEQDQFVNLKVSIQQINRRRETALVLMGWFHTAIQWLMHYVVCGTVVPV